MKTQSLIASMLLALGLATSWRPPTAEAQALPPLYSYYCLYIHTKAGGHARPWTLNVRGRFDYAHTLGWNESAAFITRIRKRAGGEDTVFCGELMSETPDRVELRLHVLEGKEMELYPETFQCLLTGQIEKITTERQAVGRRGGLLVKRVSTRAHYDYIFAVGAKDQPIPEADLDDQCWENFRELYPDLQLRLHRGPTRTIDLGEEENRKAKKRAKKKK